MLFECSDNYDEYVATVSVANNYQITTAYVNGETYMGSATARSGKFLSITPGATTIIKALVDGNYNVDGTLRHYTANSTLVSSSWLITHRVYYALKDN